MIPITKKALFPTFLFIFRFNEEQYTLKDTAVQTWPNHIGSKRKTKQVCLTKLVFTPFSLKVAWSGMFLIANTSVMVTYHKYNYMSQLLTISTSIYDSF